MRDGSLIVFRYLDWGFSSRIKKAHLTFALHPSWLIEMVPNPWLLLRQVFAKELGCLLGFTIDQTPAPLAHAHPTQVFKTGTRRLSQKWNTRMILIETNGNKILVPSKCCFRRERQAPGVSQSKIYISWITYNHIELRERPHSKNEKVPA